jgi:hypothetical protein
MDGRMRIPESRDDDRVRAKDGRIAHRVEIFVGGVALENALTAVGVSTLVPIEGKIDQGVPDECGK